MIVTVRSEIPADGDPLFAGSFCLYAYVRPTWEWLLHIGKVDYGTVRERLRGDYKKVVFRNICRAYAIDVIRVLHGELELPPWQPPQFSAPCRR